MLSSHVFNIIHPCERIPMGVKMAWASRKGHAQLYRCLLCHHNLPWGGVKVVLAHDLAAINSVGMFALHNRTPPRAAKVQLWIFRVYYLSTALHHCTSLLWAVACSWGDWRLPAMHWGQLSSGCSAPTEDRSRYHLAFFSLCLFLSQQKHSLC